MTVRAVALITLCIVSGGCMTARPVKHKTSEGNIFHPGPGYPKWSWDTVQVYWMPEHWDRVFSEEEIETIANSSNFVTIEKMHAASKDALGGADLGTKHDVARLKAANPDIKVLFYFNGAIPYALTTYTRNFKPSDNKASEQEKKDLFIFDKETNDYFTARGGRIYAYDILKPTMRKWWSDTVGKAIQETGADGVFWDQMHGWAWLRSDRAAEIPEATVSMQQMTTQAMGKDKILLCNNAASNRAYIENCDAVMYEHFNYQKHYRDDLQGYITDWDRMLEVANAGKINVYMAPLNYSRSGDISFPLACFLIGAQPYSWFMPCYKPVDFPQLRKPLGPPLEPYERQSEDKWIFTRSFQHADVWVDLEKEEAKITWK
jgi:hypothetical protein